MDTETELIRHPNIPELAVMTAYAGGQTVFLIHPDQVFDFLQRHIDRVFDFHNCAFDYWVVREHLLNRDSVDLAKGWEQVVDDGRMADTMLLDQLIVLAQGTDYPRARDLAVIAQKYAGIVEINKDDPYRLRYGEIIGADWRNVDRGFWEYAIKDPIVTWLAYDNMVGIDRKIYRQHGVDRHVVHQFGLLSQKIQIKAAIALQHVTRRGIHLDLQRRSQVQENLRERIDDLIGQIDTMPCAAGLFKRFKRSGEYQLTSNNVPRINNKKLIEILLEFADQHDIVVPLTKKKREPRTSREFWRQYSELSPFIAAWVELNELSKLNQFFAGLDSERIHPRYTTLVRTGRTSCRSPNVQQIPRSGDFREMFVPAAGKLLFVIDYAAIELRTLAAVCEEMFGESTLAEVIRDDRDPHEHTAAMISDTDLQDFVKIRDSDPKRYKSLRQRAKAINFGVPGGLGPASLANYARINYGVDMTEEEAVQWRETFLTEIYPEIGWYLESDAADVLAENLGCTHREVLRAFRSDPAVLAAKRIVQGRNTKRNGEPYKVAFIDRVWDALVRLNRNPAIDPLLISEAAGEQLERELFLGTVVTNTGRVRGAATFTQRHNTPFQGMAADGTKLALWGLHRRGYRVVAFIHDEFVIELPENADHAQEAETIDRICCEAME